MGLLIPKWESSVLWNLSAMTVEGKKWDGIYLRHVFYVVTVYSFVQYKFIEFLFDNYWL